jgi:CubicO group peptidase (beta-lactamase class C family)
MFDGTPQHDVFPVLHDILPFVTMDPGPEPYPTPIGTLVDLPTHFDHNGPQNTNDFLTSTDTVALLVLRDGSICHEHYALTGGPAVQWISWSVAKSFISALVGIAIAEGHISSVDDSMTDYITGIEGSAYNGVRIKDVLQMSSGARWNEDYNDPTSDIARLTAAMSGTSTFTRLVAEMVPENPPGTLCRYNSGDTQALGALLVSATGRTIVDYMHEKLFVPLGMEATGYWLTDGEDMEMAYGGLMLTARDFAKLGELYRLDGAWHGKQLVPVDWVRDSVIPDGTHLTAEANLANAGANFGYGYQWWLGPDERGDYSAIGVYNQFVYVDPHTDVVIVKLSANREYGTTTDESSYREAESMAFFRAIADYTAT